MLKIDARNLPTLPWGDSSKLKVAEWVLAIGNPFQLNQTVTLGIVSATGRSLEGRLATLRRLHPDRRGDQPGQLGRRAVNARGELIGINTAIFSETGGYQGIGFAVPSNLARHVMDDLIKYGEVQRGTIPGIELQPLTTQIAEQLGAPNTRGALVVTDGPALRRLRGRPAPRRHHRRASTATDDRRCASSFIRLLSDAKIGTHRDARRCSATASALTVKVPIAQATPSRNGGR